jgi:hypothetical protein
MSEGLTTASSIEFVGLRPNGLSGPPVIGDLSLGDPNLFDFLGPSDGAFKLVDLGGSSLRGRGGEGGMNCSCDGVGEGGQNGLDVNASGWGTNTVRMDFGELTHESAVESGRGEVGKEGSGMEEEEGSFWRGWPEGKGEERSGGVEASEPGASQ